VHGTLKADKVRVDDPLMMLIQHVAMNRYLNSFTTTTY